MTPPEKKTTTDSLALFQQTLIGKNYSPQSIKAYLSDSTLAIQKSTLCRPGKSRHGPSGN
jgi:hypothetical protein